MNLNLLILLDFVGDPSRALKARGEASGASATPVEVSDLYKLFRPFKARINFAECPGVSLASLASPLAIVCRAFSAPEERYPEISKSQISNSSSLQLRSIQPDRHRPRVVNLDQHIGLKLARLDLESHRS
jgi:hypothetical protein